MSKKMITPKTKIISKLEYIRKMFSGETCDKDKDSFDYMVASTCADAIKYINSKEESYESLCRFLKHQNKEIASLNDRIDCYKKQIAELKENLKENHCGCQGIDSEIPKRECRENRNCEKEENSNSRCKDVREKKLSPEDISFANLIQAVMSYSDCMDFLDGLVEGAESEIHIHCSVS